MMSTNSYVLKQCNIYPIYEQKNLSKYVCNEIFLILWESLLGYLCIWMKLTEPAQMTLHGHNRRQQLNGRSVLWNTNKSLSM